MLGAFLQASPSDFVLAAETFLSMTHLVWRTAADHPVETTAICGAAIGVSGKVFLSIFQVGCKDCRDEYGRLTEPNEGD